MSEAKRFNEGKPSLSYILQFVNPIKAIARIMELGAIKYDDGNWRLGGKPDSEYLNSMMRHLTEWIHGDVYDKDSGCSHLGHAIWNLLALHELNHPDEIVDDELFKERCAHWKAVKNLKAVNEGQIRTSAAKEIGAKLREEIGAPPREEIVAPPSELPVVKVDGDSAGKSEFNPHPVFCTCDNCMERPRGQVEFKNTWGLPAIEVFTESGEKRAAEINGTGLADVSEEVKSKNLLEGAPITVNFVSEPRERGGPLPGYQTLGTIGSVNTFDVLAALPPMDEDELVDALYTNEDMNHRAKQELSIVKSRRTALAESEAEITFSIRDLQQCESFLELKRKYILPALKKQAKVFDLEWNRAHGEYFRKLVAENYDALQAEKAAEKLRNPMCPKCGLETSSFRACWECKCGWWDYKEDSCLVRRDTE